MSPARYDVVGGNQKQRKRRCLCVLVVLVIIIALAVLIGLIVGFTVGRRQAPRVLTDCGPIEGEFDPETGVSVFKGIPFAKPPTGDLRWSPPEPLKNGSGACWEGTLPATDYKPQCAQLDWISNKVSGSEDCLYLNVLSASLAPDTLLPVMVWVHGGFLQFSNSYTPGYSPDPKLTRKLNVVFVSIQYRLNAFGFLVLDELPGSGNYGFLDQIQALKWVKANVRSFGGDPDQVTLFGQSSGSTSAWSLMMTPKARGLFNKVWLSSGSTIFDRTLADTRQQNSFFSNKSSIKKHCSAITERCLKSIPSSDIIEAIYPEWDYYLDSMDLPTKGYYEPALPVIDGELFPDTPFNLWDVKASSMYSDVPLLIGTTAQELDFEPAPYTKHGSEFASWTSERLYTYYSGMLDDFGDTAEGASITNASWALYPFTIDAPFTFSTVATDLRVTCGINLLAEKASTALTSPVYRYVIDGFPSAAVYPFGTPNPSKYAFHLWDTYAFFDALDVLFGETDRVESDARFVEKIQREVMSFVRSGRPLEAEWKPFPLATAMISQNISFVQVYHEKECKFWMDNGFLGYSWIN